MKKFLSLVLALVMTMSLVTIGAGATEYKDLSDKSEIQYEEAVAVLNKLGIITGYEDSSFKPTGALTRGAAAKIIVSLMIGPEAASALTVSAAPYKDVATTNTFAAVISYCKTAGYISGYTDGTFRPTASLTGYAFAKMLLGAVGYNGKTEGFTGSGWTMNVAKLGNKAGLFNDFATAFSGNAGVTREAACLMALNTLKATEVQYQGTQVSVSTGDAQVSVGNTSYSYVTSNNTKINQNIGKNKDNLSSEFTLEFGEEHFSDLKLSSTSIPDSFGRPAHTWTYKAAKVGTYGVTPDMSFTTKMSGDNNADKVKSMGIKDYKVATDVYYRNGYAVDLTGNNQAKLETIAATLAKNGSLVEIFMDSDVADTIDAVVVIDTQIMKVDRVTSTAVYLKQVESSGKPVNVVKDDNNNFKALSALKADDYVLVVPVATSSTVNSYDVNSIAIPQTATGKMSQVTLDSADSAVKAVTIGGTKYDVNFMNWTVEDGRSQLDSSSVNSTVDSTIYLDSYGYMIYAKDVKAAADFILVDETYSSMVDGKIVTMVKGWDMNGTALSLNIGTTTLPEATTTAMEGKIYEYKSVTTQNADYKLYPQNDATNTSLRIDTVSLYTATGNALATGTALPNGTAKLTMNLTNAKDLSHVFYFDSAVKFMFVSSDTDDNVTGITVKDGVQEINANANVQVVVNKDKNKIVTVIVPNDNDVATAANLLYVKEKTGSKDIDGKTHAIFTTYIGSEKVEGAVASKDFTYASMPGFYTFTKDDATSIYTLHSYTNYDSKSTSVLMGATLAKTAIKNDAYITTITSGASFGSVTKTDLYAKNATVVDLSNGGYNYGSLKDLASTTFSNATQYTVALVYNDQASNSAKGNVATIYVMSNNATDNNATPVVDSSATMINYDAGNYYATPTYYGTYTVAELRTALNAQMVKDGCTSITWNNGAVTFVPAGMTGTQTVTPSFTQVYKVVLNAAATVTGITGSSVTYKVNGTSAAAGATVYAKATDTIDVIVALGTTGISHTGGTDQTLKVAGYAAVVTTLATKTTVTSAETATGDTVTFADAATGTYASGVYTFSKTVGTADVAAAATAVAFA